MGFAIIPVSALTLVDLILVRFGSQLAREYSPTVHLDYLGFKRLRKGHSRVPNSIASSFPQRGLGEKNVAFKHPLDPRRFAIVVP